MTRALPSVTVMPHRCATPSQDLVIPEMNMKVRVTIRDAVSCSHAPLSGACPTSLWIKKQSPPDKREGREDGYRPRASRDVYEQVGQFSGERYKDKKGGRDPCYRS